MKVQTSCAQCGTPVWRTPYKAKKYDKAFCSNTCRGQWQAAHGAGVNHPRWKGGEHPMTCAQCGSVFYAQPADKKGERRFCGRVCQGRWYAEHLTGAASWNWKGDEKYTLVTCAECGGAIRRLARSVQGKTRFFCNDACRGSWLAEHSVETAHNNWRGGKGYYRGPQWGVRQRAVRERDDYTCQHCGLSQEEHGEALHVHHIIPFRKFRYIPGVNENYKQANDPGNLIALCRRCHALAERGLISVRPRKELQL